MSFLKSLRSTLRGPKPNRHPRRGTKISLPCESLELRQLLSTGGSNASIDQVTAQPSIRVVPFVSKGPSGYSPQQIQAAYGVNLINLPNAPGTNPTIAIVDAYSDPSIATDLAKFDAQYGLPAPPSFTVDNLGARTTDPGWALETSLDVEWAHALDPQANIILVEASSASLNGLFNAVSAASQIKSVSVVSMSWGTPEFFGEWNYDSIFTTPTGHIPITYVASSGDSGAWYGPMYPSVSPNVVAVGGTTLTLGAGGSYGSESGWSGSTGGYSGTDNGFWFGENAPSYQVAAQTAAGVSYGVRTTPDVSFNADPNTGVAVYDSVSYSGQSGWFEVGGTSAAAPSWAGLVAITDQGLVAAGKSTLSSTQLLTQLYNLPSSDFHDITTGSNGYPATTGYDLVTGLGTPKANLLVAGLLSANGVTSSSTAPKSSIVSTATSHSHASAARHLDLLSSPTDSSSSGTGVSAITTVVSAAGSVQYAALPATSTQSTQNAGSSGQAQTTTSVASSVALGSAPTSASAFGQGLQPQVSLVVAHTDENAPLTSIIDAVDPAESPAPGADPAAKPAGTPAPTPTPPLPLPLDFGDPMLPWFDAAIKEWRDGQSNVRTEKPPAGPADDREESDPQTRSGSALSVLIGTAAFVAGTHSVASCRSSWRRRWLSRPIGPA
ncbi:MAG TPA: S53 family peptidase [Isosphaeraceae bacterium]|nr:S53 family peptidase [Isosphaeraceae bacterium]